MPEEDKKKKNIFANILSWKKKVSGREPDLNIVWLYLLGVFILLLILIIVLHFLLYLRISSNEIFVSQKLEAPAVETIDRTLLESMLKKLADEEARFNELRGR